VPSAALATAGLAAVVLGCREAADHPWSAAPVWAPLAAGAGLLAAFLVRQSRTPAPLLPLRILADRARAGAYAATAAAVVGSYGFFLLLTYDLQVVRGWSPLATGLAFLPLSVSASATSFGVAGRLSHRVPARALVVPGLVLAAAGLGLLTLLSPTSGYAGLVLPAEVLLGCGMGCVFTPAITVATGGVGPRDAGIAAAAANTAMQVGGSVGTALLNTLAVTAAAAAATAGASALVHGYAVAIATAAVLLLAVAALAAVLLRPSTTTPAAGPSRVPAAEGTSR
jgi:predicted MFS family arabinose efflux permease